MTIISISHIPTSTNSAPINKQSEIIEDLLQQAYRLPLEIDRIVERLALLVSKHQIRSLKNTDAVVNILKDIRKLLNSTLRDQATINTIQEPELQAQIAIALLHLCDSLSTYLDHAIEKNLTGIKPFDMSSLANRRIATDFRPEKINDTFKFVQNKIELLNKKTDFVGLTWYNRAARKFENVIIKPCNNYHIPRITRLIVQPALAGLLIAWKAGSKYTYTQEQKFYRDNQDNTEYENLTQFNVSDNENYQKNRSAVSRVFYRLFDSVGHPYPYLTSGCVNFDRIDKCPDKYGVISTVDDFLTQAFSSTHPQDTWFYGLTLALYLSTWKDGVKPWVSKQSTLAWNFIRGGAYATKAVEGLWDFEPTARFKDVVGLDEVKESLSFIIRFIENPEKYLLMNTAPERGILLTGPTRTGKSFIVEALCGEIIDMLTKENRRSEFKVWKVDAHIIQQYGITDILETAKSNAPIVLFIDELDLLGLQRVANNQLLSQFLTSMGSSLDSDPSKQVILITATNKPETLDSSLTQYGRLGKEIRFEYPAFRFRKIYLEREFNKMALDTSQFNLNALAQKTEGRSFEDLRAIIRNSMILSWTRRLPLSQQLLEESLDTELRHIIMVDRKELPYFEKHILSVHFAGHALAMTLLDTHAAFDKVTIKAVATDLKEEAQWEGFMQKNERDKQQKILYGEVYTKYLRDTIHLNSRQEIINKIKSLLAGFMAEELLLGSCSYKCHPKNSEKGYKLIEHLVFEGLDPKILSKKQYQRLSDEVYSLFTQYKHEVKELLAQHQDELIAIADALQERDILTATEILNIIDEVNGQENKTIEENNSGTASSAAISAEA